MTSAPQPEFALTFALIGKTPKVEITEDRFRGLERDLANIDVYLQVEESWDAVVANYRALELAISEMSLDNVLQRDSNSIDEFDDTRRTCTRLVDNLLTTTRAYLDKTPSRVRSMFGDLAVERFREATSTSYDGLKGYKFMDNLRNYAQHNGSSIDSVTYGIRRVEQPEGLDALVHNAKIQISREPLQSAFKEQAREVLDRVSDDKGRIDVIPLVREYIQGLSDVMMTVRDIAKDQLEAWLRNNESAVELVSTAGAPSVGHVAVRYSENRTFAEIVELHPAARARVDRLRRRNRPLSHLTRSQRVS